MKKILFVALCMLQPVAILASQTSGPEFAIIDPRHIKQAAIILSILHDPLHHSGEKWAEIVNTLKSYDRQRSLGSLQNAVVQFYNGTPEGTMRDIQLYCVADGSSITLAKRRSRSSPF